MQFQIEKAQFHKLIQSVFPAVESKGTLAALQYIKIETVKDRVILSATNMQLSLKGFRSAKIGAEGAVAVQGKALGDVVSALPAGEISVTYANNRLQVRTPKSTFNLQTIPADQFPTVQNYANMDFKEAPKDLFEQFDRVSHAVCKDPTRYNITGVYVQPTELAATDGHRLSVLQYVLPIDKPAILLGKSIAGLRDAFSYSEADNALGICRQGNDVHFHRGDMAGTVRLIEAEFPNYPQVIPGGAFREAQVKKADLKSAIQLVTLVANQLKQVKFKLSGGLMHLKAYSEAIGDAEDSIECQYEGDFEFALNAEYLLDVLTRLKGDVVKFELRQSLSPIVIREDGYVNVIMPQRGSGT